MKEQILKLRAEKKTYSEIVKIVGCSKSTVCYYCGINQNDKTKERTRSYRVLSLNTILYRKIINFTCIPGHTVDKKFRTEYNFKPQDLLDKFGKNPKCYLTGVSINLMEPSTYSFDHIIPRSRGGSNEITNLGLSTKQANQTKNDRTIEELKVLCGQILKNI